jgi:hypothetical protein
MAESIDYADLKPREVQVNNLFGKNYLLKEGTAGAVTEYRNAISKSTKISADGTILQQANFEVEPLLVSLCIFEIENNNGQTSLKPVSLDTVRAWPHRVQQELYERAEAMTGLGMEGSTEEALLRQRDRIDRRLEQLRERETVQKNLSTAMAGISA